MVWQRQTALKRRNDTVNGISSFSLHILAMVFMLCDHMWATVIPGNLWLTCVGRLAFPIFAFLIVEGYFHTSNFKKYLLRLFVFALLSEIPSDLMYGGSWIYPFHQNVLWNFLLGLLFIKLTEVLKKKWKPWIFYPVTVILGLLFMILPLLLMIDYYHYGFLMILVFYIFRGNKWWQRLGQLAGMLFVNAYLFGGLVIPVEIGAFSFEFTQQSLAVLSLIPIWLYKGKQGYHNKAVRFCFYAFYPVHMLILWFITTLL